MINQSVKSFSLSVNSNAHNVNNISDLRHEYSYQVVNITVLL